MQDTSLDNVQDLTIVRDDGTRGRIVDQLADEQPPLLALLFDDGARVTVAASALIAQPDGTYRIAQAAVPPSKPAGGTTAPASEELVIPVVAEELEIETRQVARGAVRVHTRVETHDEVVNAQLMREEVVLEHVAVNTPVEGDAPQMHEEDGVLVIPVLEEVAVIEKRLMLREVIRVSKRRTTTSAPQTVTLRREVVDIERVESGAETPPSSRNPPQ
jgi:uncharacterized protein (TIGR02271 family)